MFALLLLFSFQLSSIVTVLSEVKDDFCSQKETCSQCISENPICFWCSDSSFSGLRCNLREKLIEANCSAIVPHNSETEVVVLEDKPITVDDETSVKLIQLQPQRVKLRIRPKIKSSVTFRFHGRKFYPLDLYYLMDLSYTMVKHRAMLISLGERFAHQMNKISKDFRLGFGSFVDKPMVPFTRIDSTNWKLACDNKCIPAYGFRNHLSLGKNATNFINAIKMSSISGNIDPLEGGLDALMQVLVCKDEIGWRNESLKMIIYASDASFHYAGDGKLGGILLPNDGKCHLDKNGFYTESSNQDYPSIKQIAFKAREHQVYIIFAVSDDQQEVYRMLSNMIDGSRSVHLKHNIVGMIRQTYRNISRTFALSDNSTDDPHLKISYTSQCLQDGSSNSVPCTALKNRAPFEFTVHIHALGCSKDRDKFNQTIQVNPVNFEEKVVIDIEMLCECDCEKPWNVAENSEKCNSLGTYICGLCKCNQGHSGKQCECQESAKSQNDTSLCYKRKSDTKACSGNGKCKCGVCMCDETYSGPYCECSRSSCKRFNNQICGGIERGVCECGKCVCNPQWKGHACECPTSVEGCTDVKNGLICSGRGFCKCGHCICDAHDDVGSYSGSLCENCPLCGQQCKTYERQVMRQIQNGTNLSNTEKVLVTLLDSLNGTEIGIECELLDENFCKTRFKYKYDFSVDNNTGQRNRKVLLYIEKSRKCPQFESQISVDVVIIVLLILFIGLSTLFLWKLFTTWIDNREYRKFIEQVEKTVWDLNENPLYSPAIVDYRNPTYGRASFYD